MSDSEFHFEFHNGVSCLAPLLIAEAESHLRELATGYPDLVGVAVCIEKLGHDELLHEYRVRVTPRIRPENLVTEAKGELVEGALIAALDAFERQVRTYQEKLEQRR
ncbi:MAG: hypothetical protein KJ077_42930 [Anaerolineae bacterium]|nr:hypothetical protein [Anaerolineae bacterium]